MSIVYNIAMIKQEMSSCKIMVGNMQYQLRIYPLLAAFEVFYDGSWHGVNCIRIRNGNLFVKFIYSGSTVEHNVDGDCLRLRSRRATCSDCSNVLKPGVDVCVQSSHTPEASSQGGTNASVC